MWPYWARSPQWRSRQEPSGTPESKHRMEKSNGQCGYTGRNIPLTEYSHVGKSSAVNSNALGLKPKSRAASVWSNTKSRLMRSAMAADHCR